MLFIFKVQFYNKTMIIFYYIIYVFISFGQCTVSEIEDYSNDSPGILPKVVTLRYRAGSDITLKCNNHHFPKMQISWEYKPCEINYNGMHCNQQNLYNDWYKLNKAHSKRKLEILHANETNSGIYRCLYDDIILKIYVLEIIVLAKYQGPPPQIISLISTNYTVRQNSHITIICNTTSIIRPEIRWFRQCIGKRCDIYDNNICFCTITMQQQYQQQNPVYSIDNFTYLSKLNIYNIKNIDSGIYVCLVFSVYGKDYKSVKINVIGSNLDGDSASVIDDTNTFSLLFLIPLAFILIPISIWLCYLKKKTNNFDNNNDNNNTIQEQQRQLIKPIVKVDIVVDKNEIM